MSQPPYPSRPPPVYGPPPGPSGYGPPPGPPGYGPLAPWGAAPAIEPPRPAKTGPSVGLIVGIGCAVLAFLGLVGIGAAVLFLTMREPATAPVASAAVVAPTPVRAPQPAAPKAELRDVRSWKGDLNGMRHFVGELVNTGTEPIGGPSAKITLLDGSNTAIESGSCFPALRVLEPGEKVPCSVIVMKADGFVTYRADVSSLPVYGTQRLAELHVADVKFTPKRGYAPASLDGKITNLSAFRAKSVMAIAGLYGADGKIVAAQTAIVAGNDLEPGAAALFSAKVFDFAAPAETYRVKAVGYE